MQKLGGIKKMAMEALREYEFKGINNLMDFIRPLILEGYPVAIKTKNEAFPYDGIVYVAAIGLQGRDIKCTAIMGDEE